MRPVSCDFSMKNLHVPHNRESQICSLKSNRSNTCKWTSDDSILVRKKGYYSVTILGTIDLGYIGSVCDSPHSTHNIVTELSATGNKTQIKRSSTTKFQAGFTFSLNLAPISTYLRLHKGDRVTLKFQLPSCWVSNCHGMNVNFRMEHYSKRARSKKAKKGKRKNSGGKQS